MFYVKGGIFLKFIFYVCFSYQRVNILKSNTEVKRLKNKALIKYVTLIFGRKLCYKRNTPMLNYHHNILNQQLSTIYTCTIWP